MHRPVRSPAVPRSVPRRLHSREPRACGVAWATGAEIPGAHDCAGSITKSPSLVTVPSCIAVGPWCRERHRSREHGVRKMNDDKKDLEALIDSSPLSRFQVVTMALCSIVAMLDGFDTQAIAFVAPEIASAWHLDPSLFGPVFGAGLLGGLIGAMIFGSLGDRLGRKPNLMAAMLIFSIGSLLTPFATSIGQLVAIRLVTGLGLGGALPCFISLTSEYSPRRIRSTLVSLMFCGFPLGAVVGGMVSTQLIPNFGWTSVFIVGGALPLLL